MPVVRCDGTDVLATYAVTKKAVDRARAGDGPAFIGAMTYRMEAHTTSDDPTRYRTEEEEQKAAETDPILRMKQFLKKRDLYDQSIEDAIDEHAGSEAQRMRDELYDAPHGDPMELFEHVYVDPTGHFERQIPMLQAELDAMKEA